MIQAKAQGKAKLDDGTDVVAPIELQLGFLVNRWGIEVLGDLDFKEIIKIDYAMLVFNAFKRDAKDRTPEDWKIVKDALSVIEGWQ